MKKSRIASVIFLLLFCLIASVFIVYNPEKSYSVGSGTVGYSGTTIAPNETADIKIRLTNASEVQAVGGYFNVQDTSCIEIVKVTKASGVTYNDSNHKFALVGMDALPSPSNILTVTVKGLKECSTKLVFSDVVVTSTEATKSVAGISNGTITVKKPTPTTTTTKAADPNPQPQTPSGGGNNNNNNNNTKTTKTTTTRPTTTKAGSNNNYLSSLSVDGYPITFNRNTTEYNITIPEEVTSIKVNATTDDKKASFKAIGTNDLSNGHNNVKVVVEAENGSTKTYVIDVFREGEVKGEEETKSNDSSLSSLKPSVGQLSPAFDKDTFKYIIYLPYEVDNITFTANATDSKSTVEIDPAGELSVGVNYIDVKVTAQGGSESTYTIKVLRGNEFGDSNNTYLKSIDISNGKLLGKFDKNNRDYYYSKQKGYAVNAIAEDDNALVEVTTYKDIVYIRVIAPNGDYSIYTLRPYKFIYSIWFYFILILIGFILGIFFKKILRKLCK